MRIKEIFFTSFLSACIVISVFILLNYLPQGTRDLKDMLVYAGGVTDFLGLSDTPNSYSSQAGKIPVVNPAEDALEFKPNGVVNVDTMGSVGSVPLLAAADAVRHSTGTTPVKVKEFTIHQEGPWKCTFHFGTGNEDYSAYAQVYRNGSPIGSRASTNIVWGNWAGFTAATSGWKEGDKLQVYIWNASDTVETYISNVRVGADLVPVPPTVDLN